MAQGEHNRNARDEVHNERRKSLLLIHVVRVLCNHSAILIEQSKKLIQDSEELCQKGLPTAVKRLLKSI
jgi:hypothetical protein